MSRWRLAGRGILGLLLAAGAVGLARQRREAVLRRRRGTVPADEGEPEDGGGFADAVAAWMPEPPRTAAGRAAAVVWTAPTSAVGVLIGLLGRGRPHWDPEFRCLVFEGVSGIPAVLLRGVGAGANAVGQVVISTYDPTSRSLLAHEALHVRQAERLGPFLLPLYILLGARYGYRRNPIERAARRAAAPPPRSGIS